MIAILTVGAPGSGKSTWGEKYAKDNRYVYLSSDKNRSKLGKGEDDQEVSAAAFALLKKEMGENLDRGLNVVVDATFMSKKSRKDFVNVARSRGATLIAAVFEVPRNDLIARNKKRGAKGGRDVPVWVIDRMLTNYETPTLSEFNDIWML